MPRAIGSAGRADDSDLGGPGLVAIGAPGGMLEQSGLDVTGDGQQIALGSSDGPPAPGSAHVYRVTASQNGQVFGGYSVVVLG